jgi:hypothetical protein
MTASCDEPVQTSILLKTVLKTALNEIKNPSKPKISSRKTEKSKRRERLKRREI